MSVINGVDRLELFQEIKTSFMAGHLLYCEHMQEIAILLVVYTANKAACFTSTRRRLGFLQS